MSYIRLEVSSIVDFSAGNNGYDLDYWYTGRMPIFEFNKLVRDKIVERQEASGATPHWRKLSPQEHRQELVRKAKEELREIPLDDQDPERVIEELADAYEALDSLCRVLGVGRAQVELAQRDKAVQFGSFDEGVYIERVELEEGDPWVEELRQRNYSEE